MFARTVRFDGVSKEDWGVGSGWFEHDYLPIAEETEGFEGAMLLVDRENANVVSVTLWRDAETVAASEPVVVKHLEHYREMTGREWTSETFEVTFDRLPTR